MFISSRGSVIGRPREDDTAWLMGIGGWTFKWQVAVSRADDVYSLFQELSLSRRHFYLSLLISVASELYMLEAVNPSYVSNILQVI